MTVPRERLVVQLRTLMDLSAVVNSSLDAAEIRQRAVESAATIVDAERSSLLILDPDTSDLCFEVAHGVGGSTLREVRLRRGQGIAGWVVENRAAAVVSDVRGDPRYIASTDDSSPLVTLGMVCVPVFSRGEVIGALQAMNKRDGEFDDYDCELLKSLAHHVAVAIENANLYESIRDAFYQTAEVLAHTVEKADPYTGEHIRRVMEYSMSIAAQLGLNAADMENLRLAAVLHDIGKIGVPDIVLQKPGGLDEHEIELIKRHSATGSDILAKATHLHPVMAAVRAHHERVDGAGYPDGLIGDDIPLAARIISVADSFDAMTTDRPYRAAMTREGAIVELRKCAGEQFDPAVTAAFIAVLEREGA